MSNAFRFSIALSIPLVLSACASPETLALQDNQKCQSFGFTPGTPDYSNCRMQLNMARDQQRAIAHENRKARAPSLADL